MTHPLFGSIISVVMLTVGALILWHYLITPDLSLSEVVVPHTLPHLTRLWTTGIVSDIDHVTLTEMYETHGSVQLGPKMMRVCQRFSPRVTCLGPSVYNSLFPTFGAFGNLPAQQDEARSILSSPVTTCTAAVEYWTGGKGLRAYTLLCFSPRSNRLLYFAYT